MNDKLWEMFGDLLIRIMYMEGTCQEKKEVVKQKAEKFGFLTNLKELLEWFDDE